MQLKDFWVGKIDGKDAFFDAPENEQNFDAFVMPESVSVARLLDRKSQFVLGLRGTGKTSILRWIAHEYKNQSDFVFILFKTDVTETKKREISKNVWYSDVESAKFEIAQDFKDSWRWFMYYHIVSALQKNGSIPKGSILLDLLGFETKWFKSVLGYFPKLVSGSVHIESDSVPFLKGDLNLEFSGDGRSVTIESLNRKIEAEVLKIELKRPLYVIFDELEVFYETDDQYKRDIRLVRDLIFCAKSLSDTMRDKGQSIYFLGGVRSEVLYALGSVGQEIERLVEDNAEKMVWHLGIRSLRHPLMDVLRAYLSINEKGNNKDPQVEKDIIFRYFPERINNTSIDKFLLDGSFYKPREIIARLTAAKDTFPSEVLFSQEVLERSRQEYGRLLFREVRYELSAIYTPQEMDAIESIFRSKSAFFSRSDFHERIKSYSRFSTIAQSLVSKRGGDTILSDLYRTGMIGNEWTERSSGRTNRWIFRGEDRLVLERQMVVNRALWEMLAIRRNRTVSSQS